MLQVVEEISSIVGEAGEERIQIHADHLNMCKFKDREDSDYYIVLDVIRRWVRDIKRVETVKKKPAMPADNLEVGIGCM